MRHSIYRISVTAHSMPFPMPSPQREQAMRILMEEAKSAGVAAAMLVTHLPRAEERSYTEPKVKAMRRIMAEVDGMSIRMLSRAFRRDCHRIRDMLGKNSTNAERIHGGAGQSKPRDASTPLDDAACSPIF